MPSRTASGGGERRARPEEQTGCNPANESDRREVRDRVAAALQTLDETLRTIVALRYYEGASSRQIGDLLDLSPGAVDMRLTRARQELRQILAPIYLADAEEFLEGGANGSDRR